MACARTVAVVVPSPAMSEVRLATPFTICAPMFSNRSLSSIAFATVTPSLVTAGAPNDCSRTTLRPLGPRVTFTALERASIPRRIASRPRVSNRMSFDIFIFLGPGRSAAAPRSLPESSLLLLQDPGKSRLDLHLDLARLRLALLGQEDAQYPVTGRGGDGPELHCRGQREAAAEGAVVTLDAVIVLPLVGVLELALAAQGQRVPFELDVDVARGDLGQLDLQGNALLIFENVHQRRPGRRRGADLFASVHGLVEMLVEELAVKLKRVVSSDEHGTLPAERAPRTAQGRPSSDPRPPADAT